MTVNYRRKTFCKGKQIEFQSLEELDEGAYFNSYTSYDHNNNVIESLLYFILIIKDPLNYVRGTLFYHPIEGNITNIINFEDSLPLEDLFVNENTNFEDIYFEANSLKDVLDGL